MIQVAQVTATRFQRPMDVGRNAPVLLDAERANGEVVEVVAKFDGAICGKAGLARELLCSLVARDLGLPVPEPFLVEFDDDFLMTVDHEPSRDLMAGSNCLAFGSLFTPGWNLFLQEKPAPSGVLSTMSEAFLFDALCFNSDRVPSNPNCLVKGDAILLIDHELAFVNLGTPPWITGAMDHMCAGGTEHLFSKQLAGTAENAQRLIDNGTTVPLARQVEYFDALPPDWVAACGNITKIRDHLHLAYTRLQEAGDELRKVLT